MHLVRHDGRVVAYAMAEHIDLAAGVRDLPVEHPDRRWAICLAMFASDILAGCLAGPYTERRAAHFARCALIPDEEILPRLECSDRVLAERFQVPLAQIAEKRLDLAVKHPQVHRG